MNHLKHINEETDLSVANEIRNQIGHKALYMLGAYNLVGDKNSLAFKIKGSKRVNYIKIILDGLDTYTIKFGKIFNFNYKEIASYDGVYNDMLHGLIKKETGLYTKL